MGTAARQLWYGTYGRVQKEDIMKKLTVVLLSVVTFTPVFAQTPTIKLQTTDLRSWKGSGAFNAGVGSVSGTLIGEVPLRSSMISVSLSGSTVIVRVDLTYYPPVDPPGAVNFRVAQAVIRSEGQEIKRYDVVLDNPYYACVSGNEEAPGKLGEKYWGQAPADNALTLAYAVSTPERKFIKWSGLAVDLGCVQDHVFTVDGTPPLEVHQCIVDVQSYFQRANTQCYIKAIYVQPVLTPAGMDVTVSLPASSPVKTATLGFSEVIEPGFTALVPSESGPGLPTGFRLGSPPRYYDITTTATYSGSINICIGYSGLTFGPGPLRLLHYEDGHWVDCTTNVDAVNQVICGVVNSLSPFAVAERTTIPVEIDIKPGSYPNSFNSNGHGVIPVAILGSADFSVTQIDPWSLSLGSMPLRVKNNGQPECSVEDINGDGFSDLVCQFADNGTLAGPGTTTIMLAGNLKPEFGETPIEGFDEIRIVP
jgi:hypothetical protein